MAELPAGLMDAMREAALAAGKNALRIQREGAEQVTLKSDTTFVTVADTQGEEIIRRALQPFMDAHGIAFLGEETGLSQGNSGFQIVVDPIDGTTNYTQGDPGWLVSIGITYNGEPVAGVTYQPELDKLCYAEQGKGAFMKREGVERPLRVTAEAPAAYVLDTQFPRHPNFSEQRAFNACYTERVAQLTRNRVPARFRNCGSAALALALLAEGARTGAVIAPVKMWDIAAAYAIAKEAGAEIHLAKEKPENLEPDAPHSLVAAVPAFYPELKQLYDRTMGRKPKSYRSNDTAALRTEFAADGIRYGVSVGRRQPMHIVHTDCIREIVAAGLHPVIVIGSANSADSPYYDPLNNPLDEAQQRRQIRRAMERMRIKEDHYTVLTLQDMGSPDSWAGSLAKLLQDKGMNPAQCVSHYRTKAADAEAANHVLKPMSATEEMMMQYGLAGWQSTNRDRAMDAISATPYRHVDVDDAAMYNPMHTELADADFFIREAKLARASNPDHDLLAALPVTALDLTLHRLANERHLSTRDVLGGRIATSLDQLQEAISHALNMPSASITGDLAAERTKTLGAVHG